MFAAGLFEVTFTCASGQYSWHLKKTPGVKGICQISMHHMVKWGRAVAHLNTPFPPCLSISLWLNSKLKPKCSVSSTPKFVHLLRFTTAWYLCPWWHFYQNEHRAEQRAELGTFGLQMCKSTFVTPAPLINKVFLYVSNCPCDQLLCHTASVNQLSRYICFIKTEENEDQVSVVSRIRWSKEPLIWQVCA